MTAKTGGSTSFHPLSAERWPKEYTISPLKNTTQCICLMNNFLWVVFVFICSQRNASEICRGVPRCTSGFLFFTGNTEIKGNDHQKIALPKTKEVSKLSGTIRCTSSRKCSIKGRASGSFVDHFRNVCGQTCRIDSVAVL